MDFSHLNETKLVNGVGYNLARLAAANDGVDFEGYVNLTRSVVSAYLRYNREVTPAKVEDIAQQGFTNPVYDYLKRKELSVIDHLILSKAHTLYFLGYGGSLNEHINKIRELVTDVRDRSVTSNEARETLDMLVMAHLRSLGDVFEAVCRECGGYAGAPR